MDGVAAEVAEEVPMLLQYGDAPAGAGEQVAEHHASGAATRDHAITFHPVLCTHRVLPF